MVIFVTKSKSMMATASLPALTTIVRPPGVRDMNSGETTRCLVPSAKWIVNGSNGRA
jgi:hypothetical protein